jgi:hypothetical protein
MMTGFLIAIAAGLASALMFASIASGAVIALLLFYLAPLPLMVAALGWGPVAAAIGGIGASAALGALFGLPYLVAFALSVAVPAWWLGHLVLLARPAAVAPQSESLAPALDWYPVGRILMWITAFAAVMTMSALFTLGTDEPSISAALRQGLQRMTGGNADDASSRNVIDRLVAVAPGAATLIVMMTMSLNVWLAAKVTQLSGRLRRPWPDLRAIMLPRVSAAALIAAILLCFAGGLIAMFAQVVSAALVMAYAMTGYAVLHTVTQPLAARGFILGSTYAATLFVGWPLVAMAGLGFADLVFGIRERYWQQQPPAPTTTPTS